MAIEHDSAVVLVSVEYDGIMTENYQSVSVIQLGVMLDTFPAVSQSTVDSVMVASDQVFVPIEPPEIVEAVRASATALLKNLS